jgi:hypothetical protein
MISEDNTENAHASVIDVGFVVFSESTIILTVTISY